MTIHELYMNELELTKDEIPRGVWNCLNVVDTILTEKEIEL